MLLSLYLPGVLSTVVPPVSERRPRCGLTGGTIADNHKTVDAFPHVDQHLQEEVVRLFFVVRERVTHGVDGALVLSYQPGEHEWSAIPHDCQ